MSASIIVTSTGRVQRALLIAGLVSLAILLVPFAIDFSYDFPIFAIPFCLLALSALVALALAIFSWQPPHASTRSASALLLAAIPLGFVASTLDCSGLSIAGCGAFCTFVKVIWIPLIALGCVVFFLSGRRWMLALLSVMAFVPLVPHCICYNPGNGWWIDHIGRSPECYVWGFAVSMLSISALASGARLWPSALVISAILSGAFGFFVGHHYFHFPW